MSYAEQAAGRSVSSPLTPGDRVFSPDGFGYVTGCSDDGKVQVAPVRDGAVVAKFHERDDVERVPDEEWPDYQRGVDVGCYETEEEEPL